MKKILFSFMSLILCTFMAQAQLTGTVSGVVMDSVTNQPAAGVAVFFYGTTMDHGSQHWGNPAIGLSVDKNKYEHVTYTNAGGQYSINYNVANNWDTVVVGVVDCNQNVNWDIRNPSTSSPNYTANLAVSCMPADCDVVLKEDSMYWSGWGSPLFIYTATSLMDSTLANISTPVTHTWSYNGVSRTSANSWGPNEDTIWVFSPTRPMSVCYQRMAQCTPVCNTGTPTPSAHSCNADFFVDSVNSINFQGQIVVWENSTVDTGATIVGYRWDFGDGSPIVNQQYPSHTYADTGVYEVCLTIISVMQTATTIDSCVSTHCDSIGFDSQGNLIYKSSGAPGFTINVVDPSTVGQSEVDLASHYKLFPNPTSDEATLSWDSEMQVERIDIFSVSGQVVKSIKPSSTSVSLNDMKTGVYIIRVSGDQSDTTLRMIVQ